MNRYCKFALVLTVLLLSAPAAMLADSLSVTPGAAMNGTSYGLEVAHDNTSPSFVQDNSPSGETVYRAEFLFNPNDMASAASINFRQPIFQALSPVPRPGIGACPAGGFIAIIRIFLQLANNANQYNIQVFLRGDSCGQLGITPRTTIASDQPAKVCLEWEQAPAGTGDARGAVAVVGPADACPSSGDPAWTVRTGFNNHLTSVEIVRLGTVSTNAFGAGEDGTMFFDEFASFRTLAP